LIVVVVVGFVAGLFWLADEIGKAMSDDTDSDSAAAGDATECAEPVRPSGTGEHPEDPDADPIQIERLSESAEAFDAWGANNSSFAGVHIVRTGRGIAVVSINNPQDVGAVDRIACENGLTRDTVQVRLVAHSLQDLKDAALEAQALRGVQGTAIDVEQNSVVVLREPGSEPVPAEVAGVPIVQQIGRDSDH